jgi:hypothetical protein
LPIEEPEEECVERAMMVLLVKQVHLQKEGGARIISCAHDTSLS